MKKIITALVGLFFGISSIVSAQQTTIDISCNKGSLATYDSTGVTNKGYVREIIKWHPDNSGATFRLHILNSVGDTVYKNLTITPTSRGRNVDMPPSTGCQQYTAVLVKTLAGVSTTSKVPFYINWKSAPPNPDSLISIALFPKSATVNAGETVNFTITGKTYSGTTVTPSVILTSDFGTVSGMTLNTTSAGIAHVIASGLYGLKDTSTITINSNVVSIPSDGYVPEPVDTSKATLPKLWVNTEMPTMNGRILSVASNGNLQAALDSAKGGDIIELAPDAVYTGNFKLKPHAGTDWVIIRTGNTTLPGYGVRATPSNSTHFATIRSSNSTGPLATLGKVQYIRIIGVKFTTISPNNLSYALIQLAAGNEKSVDSLSNHIVLDRILTYAPDSTNVQRCVSAQGAYIAIINSWLSDCHYKGADAQAIVSWNGTGPFKIVNNYLAASGENILFGGADPAIPGLTPSDIEFRKNWVVKPLTWRDSTGFNPYTEKNSFETKNAQRILAEDNVFENNWGDGQTGFAIVLKSANQSGACNWCVSQDIIFRWNVIKNASAGFNMSAGEHYNGGTFVPMNRILITQALLDSVSQSTQNGTHALFQILGGINNLSIIHTTGFPTAGSITMFDILGPVTNLVMTDNLWGHGQYGIFGSSKGEGSLPLSYYAPTVIFSRNVLVKAPATQYSKPPVDSTNTYPTTVPTSTTAGVDTVTLMQRVSGVTQ